MAAVCAIDTISFLQRIRRREPTLAQTYRRVSFKVPFMLGNPKLERTPLEIAQGRNRNGSN